MAQIKTKVKKDDTVQIIAGKDKGKRGRVIKINHAKGRLIVEGANIVKKSMKRKSQQDRGGIVELEAPLAISNVMVVCKKCGPVRVGYKLDADNKKQRVCKKCGEAL